MFAALLVISAYIRVTSL